MRAVHDTIEGPFAIQEDLAVYGLITQGATLCEGVKLILHGTIAGDLTVEPGSRAIIHGTVEGRIYNKGGRVEMFGMADAVDFLIVACPGGPATKNMVNAEVLAALGAQGKIVNIARGSIIDEAAMIKALQAGTLGGAGLDVFANEPYVPAELLAMDNVVLFPHVGSATKETRKAMGDLTLANLAAYFAGKALVKLIPELQ